MKKLRGDWDEDDITSVTNCNYKMNIKGLSLTLTINTYHHYKTMPRTKKGKVRIVEDDIKWHLNEFDENLTKDEKKSLTDMFYCLLSINRDDIGISSLNDHWKTAKFCRDSQYGYELKIDDEGKYIFSITMEDRMYTFATFDTQPSSKELLIQLNKVSQVLKYVDDFTSHAFKMMNDDKEQRIAELYDR